MDENKEIDLSKAFASKKPTFSPLEVQGVDLSRFDDPKIIQWLISYSGGLVKNKEQATYILLGFVGCAVLLSFFFFFNSSGEIKQPPQNQIIDVATPARSQ